MKISRQRRGRASGHPITGLMDRIPDSLSHSLSIYRPLSFISSFLSRLSCSFLSFFRSVALRSFRCDCRVFFFRLFFSSFSSFTYFLHPSWCLLFLSFLLPFFYVLEPIRFPSVLDFWKKNSLFSIMETHFLVLLTSLTLLDVFFFFLSYALFIFSNRSVSLHYPIKKKTISRYFRWFDPFSCFTYFLFPSFFLCVCAFRLCFVFCFFSCCFIFFRVKRK